jgi:predicted aspartyl protease
MLKHIVIHLSCPESFEGSGLVVYEAENLKFTEEKLFLEKLFLLEADGLKAQEKLENVASPLRFDFTQNTFGEFSVPCIPITIVNPINQKSMLVDGLIDTGAEGTFISLELLKMIEVQPCGENYIFESLNGRSALYSFLVYLNIASHEFNGHRVFGWENDFAIIGRDILNTLKVLIDGPQGHLILFDSIINKV